MTGDRSARAYATTAPSESTRRSDTRAFPFGPLSSCLGVLRNPYMPRRVSYAAMIARPRSPGGLVIDTPGQMLFSDATERYPNNPFRTGDPFGLQPLPYGMRALHVHDNRVHSCHTFIVNDGEHSQQPLGNDACE